MKTVAVTFGDGRYEPICQAMARRFETINGIRTVILDIDKLPPMPHAAWSKICIWDQLEPDVDRAIWFDADMIPIAPITDLIPHDDVAFAAVPDMYHGGRQAAEWDYEEVVDLPVYYNSGLFIANRETVPAFDAARARMNDRDWAHWDQTPLNIEIQKAISPARREEMPRSANWMLGFSSLPPEDIRMLHLAGMTSKELLYTLLHSYMIAFDRLTAEELAEKGGALCSGSCAP